MMRVRINNEILTMDVLKAYMEQDRGTQAAGTIAIAGTTIMLDKEPLAPLCPK
jgi:hypothetical protein